jgi:hypothetical protein
MPNLTLNIRNGLPSIWPRTSAGLAPQLPSRAGRSGGGKDLLVRPRPAFPATAVSRPGSSTPIMTRASEPPMKERRLVLVLSHMTSLCLTIVNSWQFADAAHIGAATVRQFEGGGAESREATLAVLRRAFEEAGVEFIEENGGGPGVRLRKRQTTKRKSRT